MSNSKLIKTVFTAERAAAYDKNAAGHRWVGPEILFGLSYKYMKPRESLLDIGIGTGLSSALFHKAGLLVKGIDLSAEMLAQCRSKNITVELKEHNLEVAPYPYDSDSLDHATCAGVMHLIADLSTIFQEVSRVVKEGGIFAFVLSHCTEEEDNRIIYNGKETKNNKITLYKYSDKKIERLLERFNFTELSSVEFNSTPTGECLSRFKAYVVKKGKGEALFP